MQTSIFPARFLGPILLVLGVSLVLNRTGYTAMAAEFVASRPVSGNMFKSERPITMTSGVAIVLGAILCIAGYLR